MLISVSIVTFNHEKYIAQALESVLMQRGEFDVELVVGDDCSTDLTRDIILGYQRRFPDRIRTVFPLRNLGDKGRPMFVRTLRVSKGEFIAMLDGDDYWTTDDKLQKQVAFLKGHPECLLCYHNALVVYEDGSKPSVSLNPPQHPPFSTTKDLLLGNFIASCSGMIRKELVTEFPGWYFETPWADWSLYLMASERGPIGYIDEVMGIWRIHAGGAWSGVDTAQQLRDLIRFYETIDSNIKKKHQGTIRKLLSWRKFQVAELSAKDLDISRLVLYLCQSLQLDFVGTLGRGMHKLLNVVRRIHRACRNWGV